MERGKSVWLVLVIVITLTFFSENNIEISAEIQKIAIKKLVTHEPIEIICDQNFTDYGFPGSGTKSDPFIISGFYIKTTNFNQNNIMIKYTTKYFIIENCELTKPNIIRYPNVLSSSLSIYIRDCKNGTVIIRKNLCVGIVISNTTYSVIEDNELNGSIDNGILVHKSPYTFVRSNYVHDNGIGIQIYNSHHCFIERNEVINNSGYLELVSGIDDLYIASGIYLHWKCSHNVVQDNYVVNNRHGIKVYRSDRVNITSNVIIDSKETSL
ncbi:MAG: right-handed parallel beta-helix repeat-containing protein, partial [Candidatus Heimdallarchaeaceae archaeon]